jgi:hypothetical protein
LPRYPIALFLTLLLVLSACTGRRGQGVEGLPTLAEPESAMTAAFMTENAPPPGFRDALSFPDIDAGLQHIAGWRYLVTLEFDGVFVESPQHTTASASAEVWFNQVGSARRLLVETTGELIGQTENNSFEAVRMGPDAFLIRDGVCLSNAGDDAARAADLRAGLLVGGVNNAVPTGKRAILNGVEAWEYRFEASDLVLPAIQIEDPSTMQATGELWVAPSHNVVVRFYVNLNVENAYIFDRELPVNGQVLLRYDLHDVGEVPNITVPFGC